MSRHFHDCEICECEYQCADESGSWAEYCALAENFATVCVDCEEACQEEGAAPFKTRRAKWAYGSGPGTLEG